VHLYHYTPETISKILEKNGWKVKRILHQKTYRTIFPTIAVSLKERFQKDTLITKWLSSELGNMWQLVLYPLSFLLGVTKLSGRMTIWAQKE
jgi:hypothetical protein